MAKPFKRIVIFGKKRYSGQTTAETLRNLQAFLQSLKLEVALEAETAVWLKEAKLPTVQFDDLHQHDLIIVVGGDGNLLTAARAAAKQDVPVLGINRGRLGFLTDILPDEIEKITEILAGNYEEESRFLLEAVIQHEGNSTNDLCALNDVVLFPGASPHMLEFDIYINTQFVCRQRADGLIVATPTGSTAYALSGGGPILHPKLDAIVMLPMFPHTLSNRPIVIDGDSNLTIVIDSGNNKPRLSCDGQSRIPISLGDSIHIKKQTEQLRLIHPLDYNYYETLRSKLGWQAK